VKLNPKKLLVFFYLAIFVLLVLLLVQRNLGIRLIVRGDDMGFCHAANEGCIKSYEEGIMTVVEVMVPGPYFLEAVKMLNENPDLDVGIHLTLTSEWENIKWGPLTDSPSLADEDGNFYQMVWPDDAYPPHKALATSNWKLEEIEKEIRAQIELALKHIPHISHMTPHMAFHQISPQVRNLLFRLAKEYGLNANIRFLPLPYIDLFGNAFTAEERIANAVQVLEELEPGTWQCYEHPGMDTPEMRNVWHNGDENVAIARDAVTKAFTSEKVKEVIARRKIKLIGYKDLKFWH
jgi:predicted glycoside hydrolase/deacetylase ChbG (UPF0249 family)